MEGFGLGLSYIQHKLHPFQSPLTTAIWPNQFPVSEAVLSHYSKNSLTEQSELKLKLNSFSHPCPDSILSCGKLCFVHNHPGHCVYRSYFYAFFRTTYIIMISNFYLLPWLLHCPNFYCLYSVSSTCNLSYLILLHRSLR